MSFVNKQLFDSDCIRRLMAGHKLVKKNGLFSDVVKSRKVPTKQPDSQINVKKPLSNCIRHEPTNTNWGRTTHPYGNANHNTTFAKDEVLEQGVSHMCNVKPRKAIVENHNKCVKTSSSVHINRFQPLSDMDFHTVSNCHSVKVGAVIEDVGNKNICDIPLATEKYITKSVQGKHRNLLYPKHDNVLDRGHVGNHKSSKATVINRRVTPHSECDQTHNCQKAVMSTPEPNTTLTKNDYGDKYVLELHNSDKSKTIQEAKAAPGNEKCIHKNRPLFSFMPIYGLKMGL